MRRQVLPWTRALAIAVAFVIGSASYAEAAGPPAQIEPTQAVTGNVDPDLGGSQRLGTVARAQRFNFTVVLAPRDRVGLERFVAAVSDMRSPAYGQYITPEVFADRFGPTPASVATVSTYLASHGIEVRSVDPNRLAVHAGGSAAAIDSAFGSGLSNWYDPVLGRAFIAGSSEPRVPAPVAGIVSAVLGLDNHHPAKHHAVARTSSARGTGSGHNGSGAFTPADLHVAYDISSALLDGAGQTIGLYELDSFKAANVATYRTEFKLPFSPIYVNAVDNFPTAGTPGPGQIEVEFDIEVVNAIAPGASVTVWEGFNGPVPGQPALDGTYDVYAAMVNSNSTRVNSTSWGDCESNIPQGYIDAVHMLLMQAAAQRQTWFAASGDNGPYDCPPHGVSGVKDVDYPASDPMMTGVGGTALATVPGTQSYVGETAWSSPPNIGSGGGLSTYFSLPWWQTGPGVTRTFSNGRRQVPDIASDADPRTGYDIYSTIGQTTTWFVVGGTSGAAPSWAGFAALYNNWAGAHGKPNLGFANPALYQLAASPQTYPPFHDVTTGSNLYYPAGPGWDFATGLGSYDALAIARDLAPGAALPYPPPGLASAVGGAGFATISWGAASVSPNPILKYTVTASPGGQVATVGPAVTSATLFGLAPGSYTFLVTALYAAGGTAITTGPTAVGQYASSPRVGTPWSGGSNAVGVAAGATDAYFAEGTTLPGFDEYLTIQTGSGQSISIDYLFTDASVYTKSYSLGANSRTTILVNGEVGPGRDVSVHIRGSAPFVAERPMYFNFNGLTGGHDVVGATAPGTRFLFAEGSTRPGFQEYLTLLNPGDTASVVTTRYFTQTGPLAAISRSLPPHSRTTVDVNAEAGTNLDLAVEVDATAPILAERPMYFAFNGWTGGHVVAGAAAPATTANLAEGLVRAGSFSEYLTILNTNPTPTAIRLSFLLTGGAVVAPPAIYVGAGSRATVSVGSLLPDGTASAVHVSSDLPVVVERPMYFNFEGIRGGHDAMGLPDSALAPVAVLAEGFTGPGFHEYLTVLNAGAVSTTATVTYFVVDPATNSTSILQRTYSLLMHSRTTIDVNSEIGPNRSVSVRVDTNPILPGTGPATPIEVERPLYFAY